MDWFDQENGDEQAAQEHPLAFAARIVGWLWLLGIGLAALQGALDFL